MRALVPLALAVLLLAGGISAHASRGGDAAALSAARREAQAAEARYQVLQRQADSAGNAAARARAQGEALTARLIAAEAGLTAAERRIAIVERMEAAQRERLAERQRPLIHLTGALQTMARRPAALALVQPGSVEDIVRVRSLLAATLPEIRRRTAALRAEVDRANALRRQSVAARGALLASRSALGNRRAELALFEAQQRSRSDELEGLALAESDRALVFGEEARTLTQTLGARQYQAQLSSSLAELPGPLPRPTNAGAQAVRAELPYLLPVDGRLLVGVGEISDGGVHSRGLTFATDPRARVVAPAAARVTYAAPFRGFGHVVILDHGRGWSSVVTGLNEIQVQRGQAVRPGALLGRAGVNDPQVTVELRRNGRPVPIAELIAG